MLMIENLQKEWMLSQINSEAKRDFHLDFSRITDELSKAFRLDDAIYENAAGLKRGVAGTLNRFGSYGDQLGAGDYLNANLDKMQNVLLEELASPKSNGTNKIWVGGISLRVVDDVTQGWGKDGAVTREQALGKLILGAARVKALSREDGIPETYVTARSEVANAIKIIEKAAAILFDTETGTVVDMATLLDRAIHPNKGLAGKLGAGSLAVATLACTAVVPTEESPTFDPPIIATNRPAITETVPAPTMVPSPEAGVKRVEVTAVEYSGEELTEKLKNYEAAKVYSYDSDGGLIVLEGIDKPTGKAAFTVDGKEYVTAFGVNGVSYIMYKDGDRFVAAEFDNLRAEDGSPIENAFGYHLYVDPATRQIAEKIDAKMWRIPVFTILKDVATEDNILLHFNLDDLLLGDAGFKQVISSGKPADAMLSIVSPELFKDIDAAPTFVQEINFEGDWKVVFDDDGNVLLIDAENSEEIGSYDNGKWVEPVSFEPMELSIENIGACDYEADIASGRLAWSVEQAINNGEIIFPEDAYNAGWENREGETNIETIFLNPDSNNAVIWVNLCKISDKFLELPNEHSFVATVAVINKSDKNSNGRKTYGVIHYFLRNEKSISWFKGIPLSELGPRKYMVSEQVEAAWDLPGYADFARLYRTQGDNRIRTALNRVQLSGIVDDEVGTLLLHPEER